MRGIFIITLSFALSVTSAEAVQKKVKTHPKGEDPLQSLNLNLSDESSVQSLDNAQTNLDLKDKENKSVVIAPNPGEAGKFSLKPEFNFVENKDDYNTHDKGTGQEVKLNLNYNF